MIYSNEEIELTLNLYSIAKSHINELNQKKQIERLEDQHIQGSAQYFSSIRSRDNFIDSIKNNILKISIDELRKIQNYWKIKNEVIDYKMDPVKRTQEKKYFGA